jgi:hypothetical protein
MKNFLKDYRWFFYLIIGGVVFFLIFTYLGYNHYEIGKTEYKYQGKLSLSRTGPLNYYSKEIKSKRSLPRTAFFVPFKDGDDKEYEIEFESRLETKQFIQNLEKHSYEIKYIKSDSGNKIVSMKNLDNNKVVKRNYRIYFFFLMVAVGIIVPIGVFYVLTRF